MKKFLPIAFLSIAFVLLLLFLNNRNTQNFVEDQKNTPTVAQKSEDVVIMSPSINDPISSPVIITGKIKSNWMFEGTFSVELLDQNRQSFANSACFETVPGSWTSEGMIDFLCDLKFNTNASKGYLKFFADNPSGLPQNEKSFEIPVIIGQDTTSWKTYKNEKYGFEFDYPKNLKLSTEKITADDNQLIYDKLTSNDYSTKIRLTDFAEYEDTLSGLQIYINLDKNNCDTMNVDNIKNDEMFSNVIKSQTNGVSYTSYHRDWEGFVSDGVILKTGSLCPVLFFDYGKNYQDKWQSIRDQLLSTFKFTKTTTPTVKYTCPAEEWVDCMPGPGPVKPQCQPEFLQWAQSNCPNFQGAAL